MKYDYYENETDNIVEAFENWEYEDLIMDVIENNDGEINNEDLYEALYDELWVDDSITGNASGSYTFDYLAAKQYVMSNIDLLHESAEELGGEEFAKDKLWFEDYEQLDVLIRCHILGACLDDAIRSYDFSDYIKEWKKKTTNTTTKKLKKSPSLFTSEGAERI